MYIPIMKNRTVEVSVLQQLSELGAFENNTIPLVELIQDKTRSNNKKSFIADLAEILHKTPNMRIMVDFLKSTKLRSTTDAIREYISLSNRHPEFCIERISALASYSNQIIPVISYLTENPDLDRISYEAQELRKLFPQISFRIRVPEFDRVFSHVETLLTENDFVILDIDSASHMSPVFKKIYKRISDSKKSTKFTSIIVNAHRPENLQNKDMTDGEPIAEIDNSLKELYNSSYMYKFDGFGDYACISAALPSTGGAISPVGIYYSSLNNYFISYRCRTPLLSEFPEYITPNILKSEYWEEFTQDHHQQCPGCKEILSISNGEKSGRNQAQWKMITMLHYIYTMYEEQV